MTGIPVVSIGPSWMRIFPYGPDLFEGHEIVRFGSDDPAEARRLVQTLLADPGHAAMVGHDHRQRAIDLFGKATIGKQWAAFLDNMTPAQVERRLVGAAA